MGTTGATSLLARFVDDIEILFDDATKSIHFRSAARTGYYVSTVPSVKRASCRS